MRTEVAALLGPEILQRIHSFEIGGSVGRSLRNHFDLGEDWLVGVVSLATLEVAIDLVVTQFVF